MKINNRLEGKILTADLSSRDQDLAFFLPLSANMSELIVEVLHSPHEESVV